MVQSVASRAGHAGTAPPACPLAVTAPAKLGKIRHEPQTEAELESLRRSVNRGQPFGSSQWTEATAKQLNLESTLRPRGRPKNAK